MIVPLKLATLRAPLPYVGGPTHRDLPMMPAVVEAGNQKVHGRFLIDTGADSIEFPLKEAQQLGIDLLNAPTGSLATASGASVVVHYAQITISLSHGFTTCRWQTWAGFAPIRNWLFGHFGGLEHFHFVLDSGAEEFMLVPRESLPLLAP